MLVEHRIDDVYERLVAVEDPVPAGEEVALQPPLAEMLRQHLQDASVRRELLVGRLDLRVPRAPGGGEDVAEAVRSRLVGPEEPEVLPVAGDHVAQKPAEHTRRL